MQEGEFGAEEGGCGLEGDCLEGREEVRNILDFWDHGVQWAIHRLWDLRCMF